MKYRCRGFGPLKNFFLINRHEIKIYPSNIDRLFHQGYLDGYRMAPCSFPMEEEVEGLFNLPP